jgi:hypothetical protein
MKKNLIIIFAFTTSFSFSQSQNWWRVNGNTPSNSDFVGTTNNTSLIFKTNNVTRFSIDGSGNLNFPSLTGTGVRF